MNDTINNESNVNDDNGVTYASGSDNTYLVGTVWSIGLACEVEVIGHSTDQSDDVWHVTRDIDGDSSPDTAIRRSGADLLPNFTVGSAVTIPMPDREEGGYNGELGIVTTRGSHGLYVVTASTLTRGGWTSAMFAWEWVRERFHEGLLGPATGPEADLAVALHKQAVEQAKRASEVNDRLAGLEHDFETFKETVRKVAGRYARKHELCGVVNEALDEMGLDSMIQPRFEVTVNLTRTYRINADDEDEARERVLHLVDDIETSGEDNAEDFEAWGDLDKDVTEVTEVDE